MKLVGSINHNFFMVMCFLLSSTLTVQASALIVRRDMGGSVDARVAEIAKLDLRGTSIEIAGTCVSACTLFLGADNACVKPNAKLGFHGPTSALRGIPLVPTEFERVSNIMASYYPPEIRSWFLAEARNIIGDYIVISGRQAIKMGARPCN